MNQSDPSDDTRQEDDVNPPAAADDQVTGRVSDPETTEAAAPDAMVEPHPSDADESPRETPKPPELPPVAADVEPKPAEPAEGEPEPQMDWYILKVAFNREDSIAESLRKRVKMEGMGEFFGDIVVPTEDVATFTRDGKRRVTKRKLLPGYVMANMIINDDTWFLVRETSGISDFTGTAGKPMPMEPEDVQRFIMRGGEDDEEETTIKTAIPFDVGDRVRVKEGNFENQEGEVDAVDEANGRVTVIINIFGRSVPMELDHWQIEPL